MKMLPKTSLLRIPHRAGARREKRFRLQVGIVAVVIMFVVLWMSPSGVAQGWTAPNGLIIHGTVVTMNDNHDVIPNAAILVRNGVIVRIVPNCVYPYNSCDWGGNDITNALKLNTEGLEPEPLIFPGLISLHNHTAYNTFPIWQAPKVVTTECPNKCPKKYQNRYQWTSPKEYKQYVNSPKKILSTASYLNLAIESLKWSEIKTLVGGQTTDQGTPDLQGVSDILVRNVENRNFGKDYISQRGLAVTDTRWLDQVEVGQDVVARILSDTLDAWIVHLAEGIDDSSRAELDVIAASFPTTGSPQVSLLDYYTLIIHGTAFRGDEWPRIKAADAKVIWSPTSNLLLYGDTTRLPMLFDLAGNADELKVLKSQFCLGTDWSPSGTKNLIDEMKVAFLVNKYYFSDARIDPQFIVDMTTRNPANAVNWYNFVGHLENPDWNGGNAPLVADLFIVADNQGEWVIPEGYENEGYPSYKITNVYESLIWTTPKDVRLVLIGGEPLYGDIEFMDLAKPGDYEVVCSGTGFQKAIDVTNPLVKKGDQTYAYLLSTLTTALKFDMEYMRTHFSQSVSNNWDMTQFTAFFNQTFPEGVPSQPLDPIYLTDDDQFFPRVLGAFPVEQTQFDPFRKAFTELEIFFNRFKNVSGAGAIIDEAELLNYVNSLCNEQQGVLEETVGLDAETAANILSKCPDSYTSRSEMTSNTSIGPCAVLRIESYLASLVPPPVDTGNDAGSGDTGPGDTGGDTISEYTRFLLFLNDLLTTKKLLITAQGANCTGGLAISTTLADAILSFRNSGPFQSIDDYYGVSSEAATYEAAIRSYADNCYDPGIDERTVLFINDPNTTFALLDNGYTESCTGGVGLTSTAANNIINYRSTNSIDSVAELDAISLIGDTALYSIWLYVYVCYAGKELTEEEMLLLFLNHPSTTFDVLRYDVKISSTAATNIMARRNGSDGVFGTSDDQPFVSIDDVDSVYGVGIVTLDMLKAFASTWKPPMSDDDVKLLTFVNHESVTASYLTTTVGVYSRAASNIINYRDGPDGSYGTADDKLFKTVDELRVIAYVSQTQLDLLYAFSKTWSPSTSVPKVLVFVNHETTTLAVLKAVPGIYSLACPEIIKYRSGLDGTLGTGDDVSFKSVDELDAVKYVGDSTLQALINYAENVWQMPTQ